MTTDANSTPMIDSDSRENYLTNQSRRFLKYRFVFLLKNLECIFWGIFGVKMEGKLVKLKKKKNEAPEKPSTRYEIRHFNIFFFTYECKIFDIKRTMSIDEI